MRYRVPLHVSIAAVAAGASLPVVAADAPEVPRQPAATTSQAPPTDAPHQPAAADVADTGLEFFGYFRSGVYRAEDGEPKGQYQLGGPLDHYRLGNEGDTYLEFGIGKKFPLDDDGHKLGVYAMPTIYDGKTGTAQAYADVTGFAAAPGASLWAGQRYHRVQDVHILDNWLMGDGDNYGVGIDDFDLHVGKLNLGVYTDGNLDAGNSTPDHARRVNFQWRGIPTNAHGS